MMPRDAASIKDDAREVKHRPTGLEGAAAALKRDQAASYTDTADQHARCERSAERWGVSNMAMACGIAIVDYPPPQRKNREPLGLTRLRILRMKRALLQIFIIKRDLYEIFHIIGIDLA